MGRGGQRGRVGHGGPSKNSPGPGGLDGTFVPCASNGHMNRRQNDSHHSHTFSLREEARNTELHHSWNSDLKLRHAKVNFVNAGKLDPKETVQEDADIPRKETVTGGFEFEVSMSNMSLEDRMRDERLLPKRVSNYKDESSTAPERNRVGEGYAESARRRDVFFVDVKGSQKPADTGFLKPSLRCSPSPSRSDSSEEVIIFSGRSHHSVKAESNEGGSFTPKPTPTIHSTTSQDKSRPANSCNTLRATVVDDPPFPVVDKATTLQPVNSQKVKLTTKSPEKKSVDNEHLPDSRLSRQNKRRKRSKKQIEEDEILADYLENIENGEGIGDIMNNNQILGRDLGDMGSEGWQDQSSENEYLRQRDTRSGDGDGWDSTDLQDIDDLSTSDEVQAFVEVVLSKRTRPSGLQYLVVWEGYTTDDACWIPLASLITPSAKKKIRIFEAELVGMEEFERGIEDSEDSEMIDERVAMDLQDELEDMKDEQDLLDRKRATMTDEQIARLLSKQEELGLGSDELVLFDGDEEEGSKGWDSQASPLPLSVWNQTMTRKKKSKQPKEFPSASVLAAVLERDPYNGFDVMDHDRPSLRKKSKGRRGQLPLEFSDSEQETKIQTAWGNDRSKKKARKQEREELRAQGLLGKKGKVDVKAKYQGGMSWDEVKKEISEFLVSSKQTLSLPPMNPHDRKRVHEIANKFNLKSKSVGGGTSRFPTLYKTSRTMDYDEDALSGIDAQLNSKRFMHRPDVRGARGPTTRATATRRGRGGFAGAGVSYKDGEVVGATAPEIGVENRGRTILEKMGWSTGTALGALNNKGILQPVTHVVKTTKAGLG